MGDRKAERKEEEERGRRGGGEEGREGGEGSKEPGDFLAVKKALSPFQDDEAHQTVQTAHTMPHIQIFLVKHVILYTLAKCFSQQVHHTQRLDILWKE